MLRVKTSKRFSLGPAAAALVRPAVSAATIDLYPIGKRWAHGTSTDFKDRLHKMESVLDAALNTPTFLVKNVPKRRNSTFESGAVADNNSNKAREMIKNIQSLYLRGDHLGVLVAWEKLHRNHLHSLTIDVLKMVINSAESCHRPRMILTLVELGQSMGIKPTDTLVRSYLKACRRISFDAQQIKVSQGILNSSDAGLIAWNKAVGMLEVALAEDILGTATIQDKAITTECFEETVTACSYSGKWRHALDLLEKAHKSKCKLTERMVSQAVICCSLEKNGISAAFNLYSYMLRENLPRSAKMYNFLLSGLARSGRTKDFEGVWKQTEVDKIPRTDAMYAARVEAHARAGDMQMAENTLKTAIGALRMPLQTYHAMHSALLRAGDFQHALALIEKMKKKGMQTPEMAGQQQYSATYHLMGLIHENLLEEALHFLKQGMNTTVTTSETVTVTEAAETRDVTTTDNLHSNVSVRALGSGNGGNVMITYGDGYENMKDDSNTELQLQSQLQAQKSPPLSVTVSASAWRSLFRTALSVGNTDVAIGVFELASSHPSTYGILDEETTSKSSTSSTSTSTRVNSSASVGISAGPRSSSGTASLGSDNGISITTQSPSHVSHESGSKSLNALLKVLSRYEKLDEAAECHRKALRWAIGKAVETTSRASSQSVATAIADHSTGTGTGTSTAKPTPEAVVAMRSAISQEVSITVEGYIRTLSHSYIYHLSEDHHWDAVLNALEEVHSWAKQYCRKKSKTAKTTATSSMSKTSADNSPAGNSSGSQQVPSIASLALKEHHPEHRSATTVVTISDTSMKSLQFTYAAVMRQADRSSSPYKIAKRLMAHQRAQNITPSWACCKYAMKAYLSEAKYDDVLDLFAVRRHSAQYIPADEPAYNHALIACKELLLWQESIEILADLLTECEQPGQAVFRVVIDTLVATNQNEMVVQVLKMMNDRDIAPVPATLQSCAKLIPMVMLSQLTQQHHEHYSEREREKAHEKGHEKQHHDQHEHQYSHNKQPNSHSHAQEQQHHQQQQQHQHQHQNRKK